MPFEDLSYDQFINKWSFAHSLIDGIAGYLYGTIGLILIFVAINISAQYSAFAVYLSFFLPILYFPLMLSRNRIIKFMFEKRTNHNSYAISRFLKFSPFFVSLAFAYLFAILSQRKLLSYESGAFFFVASVILYLSVYQIFTRIITKEGEIHVEFICFVSNISDFDLRQRWLGKIFGRLEDKLKNGRISISRDKLLYYFNLAIFRPELFQYQDEFGLKISVEDTLNKIEKWLVNDESDGFLNSLTSIVPKSEFKPLEKPSFANSLSPYMPSIISGVFVLIGIAILAIIAPHYINFSVF